MKHTIYAPVLCLLLACGQQKTAEKKETAQPVAENLVQLTDAQLKNAGITTTRAEKRNIATALKVSGRIDVPPQNIVSISFPLGGYLKSTNLLPGMHEIGRAHV